jgi:hypothetical protein
MKTKEIDDELSRIFKNGNFLLLKNYHESYLFNNDKNVSLSTKNYVKKNNFNIKI